MHNWSSEGATWYQSHQKKYYDYIVTESNISVKNKEKLLALPEYFYISSSFSLFGPLVSATSTSALNTHFADMNELSLTMALANFDSTILGNKLEIVSTFGSKFSNLSQTNVIPTAKALVDGVHMAEVFQSEYFQPKCVWWTGRYCKEFETMSKLNPSDVMTLDRDGNYLGISVKSSKKNTGKVAFKNLGLSTLGSALNVDLMVLQNVITDEVLSKNGFSDLLSKSLKDRKDEIRSNPELKIKLKDLSDEILQRVMNTTLKTIEKLSNKRDVLLLFLDNSNVDDYPYIKLTSTGSNVDIFDPRHDENMRRFLDPDASIHVGQLTPTSIFVMLNHEKFFKIRFKWTSEPLASNIKVLGEYW